MAELRLPEGGAHQHGVENDMITWGYYSGGGGIVDVSGGLAVIYRQGREVARIWTGDPDGFRPNLPLTWGRATHNG